MKPQALRHPRPTSDLDTPADGFWPGTVVSLDDPDKEGKIQVRVDQFYGAADEEEKIEDGDLPWARPGGFITGADSGTPHLPRVGAGVWVGFWGGSREHPVWFGGFYGSSDVPSEFSSAYSPDPQTWLTKTPHGHVIEMRWKEGESEVYFLTKQGVKLRLIDSSAIGGMKLIGTTPAGFEFSLDEPNRVAKIKTPALREVELNDTAQSAHMVTPTQRVELLDTVPVINITTPGSVNVQAALNATVQAGINATVQAGVNATVQAGAAVLVDGAASAIVKSVGPTTVESGALLTLATAGGLAIGGVGGGPMGGATNINGGGVENKTFAGAATWNYTALTLNATGLLAFASLVLFTLTGAGLALATTAAAITIGSLAGIKLQLCNANLIAAFNAHTNGGMGVDQPIAPGAPPPFDQNTILTQNVVAD